MKTLLDEFDAMGITVEALPELKSLAPLYSDDMRLREAVAMLEIHRETEPAAIELQRFRLIKNAQPTLLVGCSRDWAIAASGGAFERESSLVTCVAAYCRQPTFDPKRMQEWVPEMKLGAPALGCKFDESLKRRDELLPALKRWSPDYLLHMDAAPMFFENEWGLTQPKDITKPTYDTRSPRWALGFQKLALAAGAECRGKCPNHPAKDIGDLGAKRRQP